MVSKNYAIKSENEKQRNITRWKLPSYKTYPPPVYLALFLQILLHLPRSLLLVRTWRGICLCLSPPQCLCWNLIVPPITYCTYDIMWPLDFWRFHIIAFVLCGTSVIMEREICFPIWNLRLFSCACENLLKTNFQFSKYIFTVDFFQLGTTTCQTLMQFRQTCFLIHFFIRLYSL